MCIGEMKYFILFSHKDTQYIEKEEKALCHTSGKSLWNDKFLFQREEF